MNRLSFERLRLRSDLWHDRGFVKLWAANGISQLGTQVTLLALPLTALYVLNASTLAVALLRSFAVLPFLLFSLPAGVWIDRVRRRPLMIVADFGRAIAIVSIPVAYWFGHLSMTQLYVVVAIHGLLSVVFDVSYLSFLPTLVGRPQLGEANAKLLGTQSLAQLIGPTLAGSLVAAFGAPVAVFADAVSFGVSGGFVSAIRGREPKPEPSHARARTELVEGLRYVFSQPYLRTLTIWFSVGNLFSSAIFALIVVYFVRDLHLGAASIGWVLAVINVGFIAGAFANRPLVERFGIGRMIAYPALLSPIALMTIPAAPTANPYPVLILGGVAGTFIALLREREPADAPAVDHAAPPARPDELGGAVHVLGHDPARLRARRSRRREHRAADDAVRRVRLLDPRRRSRSRSRPSGSSATCRSRRRSRPSRSSRSSWCARPQATYEPARRRPAPAPRLPEALGGSDREPARLAGLAAGAAARGGARPARVRVLRRAARNGRHAAVPPVRAAGGSLDRPDPAAAGADRRRHRPRARARDGADRRRVREA